MGVFNALAYLSVLLTALLYMAINHWFSSCRILKNGILRLFLVGDMSPS